MIPSLCSKLVHILFYPVWDQHLGTYQEKKRGKWNGRGGGGCNHSKVLCKEEKIKQIHSSIEGIDKILLPNLHVFQNSLDDWTPLKPNCLQK